MANIFSRPKTTLDAPAPAGVRAADPEVNVSAVVALPRGPVGDVAVDTVSGVVVTANSGNRSISVLDADTLGVRGVVKVDGDPVLVTVADDRAYVAIAASDYDAVVVVNLNNGEVLQTYPLAFSATALTASPDGKRVFVGRTGEDRVDVAVIDTTAERVGIIGVPYRPGTSVDALAVDHSGRHLYVAVTGLAGSALLTVDTGTGRTVRRLRLASPIRDLALGREGLAYVLRSDRRDGGSIDVVDLAANAVTFSVAIGGAPTQLVVSPDGARAYAVDYDRVAVFDTLSTEIVDEITGPGQPSCVAVRGDGRSVYVADYDGAITALELPVTAMPLTYSHFVATDPIIGRQVRELEPAV
ncbi:YncE family protein [Mycolicibacterium sp. S2-37]|uniref:YncE family protein n=1 Tax=Mycolicibacterium sp. S2-37 TaxID=2810297 RepID=UPI001A943DCB|nr:YncE family protein [Mycolicibacterium sp. S2-37]MBO0679434.1 YncE family protein [Mycolicibacterium sp. S2-37]